MSRDRIRRFLSSVTPKMGVVVFAILFGVIGIGTLLFSHATTPTAAFEAENGTASGCAGDVSDASASGGAATQFGASACGAASAGAHLPISYNLSSLTGTVRYMATNGSDSNAGTAAAPYATLSKAYSASAAGDTIVVRGGTYRQGNLTFTKAVKVIAYPGEIPVFNGAQTASSGWTTEGSYQYHSYTAMPVTDGSGISFTTGQNLNGAGDGKFPDQAWVGSAQLKQVQTKGALQAGMFYVESGRLYMMASDVAKGNVEVSNLRSFVSIQAANTTLEGIRITRFSNTASDYGVVKILENADNATLRNVEVSESAFMAVLVSGSSNLNTGLTFKNVTILSANWMGVSLNYTDNATFDGVNVTNTDQWDEFSNSPQSGAIKTSRTRYTKVLNSQFTNNKGPGVWFDQSNYDAQVANNIFTGNTGTSFFYEISDKLTFVNNYIVSPSNGERAFKAAGSSGLRLINNTIIGGDDPVGIYVDGRSIAGCANPANAVCSGSYSSDRDSLRPYLSTIDWIPRIDMMYDNIIAYPKAIGYCGGIVALCINKTTSGVTIPINTIIHQADSLRPKTAINGNVYANGTGSIIGADGARYTTPSAFASVMAGSPVNISGFETAGLYGDSYVNTDGSPTAALAALHSQAAPVPTDSIINQYIPAGTKHYGVTYK